MAQPSATPANATRPPAPNAVAIAHASDGARTPAYVGAGAATGVAAGARAGAAGAGAGRVMAFSTAEKNSPAVRLPTLASMRWPTPPIMPPTVASAS